MLKHVLSVAVAFLIVALALCVWTVLVNRWPFVDLPLGSTSLRTDGPPFVVSAILFTTSIIVVRTGTSWPALLLLVGASALFVARLHDVVIFTAADYQLIPLGGSS